MNSLCSFKGLLVYLMLGSCSLLITFMYAFQGGELPMWRQFYNVTVGDPQPSGDFQRNNDYDSITRENRFPSKIETSNQNEENSRNYTDFSVQKGQIKERSTLLNSQSYLLQEVHNTFDKKREDFNRNYILSVTQNQVKTNVDGIDVNEIINLQLLANILNEKLKFINVTRKIKQFKPTCESDFKLANSCDENKCLQKELPENLTTRIGQLVANRKFQMPHDDHVVLHQMAKSVNDNYDIILLTAASSNHFLESQALLKNLHENVYPYLKNFTLIFYNLGLTEYERALMVRYCKCQVKDFPFDKLPSFMTSLSCYSWKPVLIKAHLQKANIVFWMDASIRFHNSSTSLNKLIQATRERGLQIGGSGADSTFRTHRSMYHFFGDEPCAYLSLGQAKATYGVYHREYFVDRVILEPWVACALNHDCMCPQNKDKINCEYSKRVVQNYYRRKGPIVYGLCHRFDQSAISLILHKLYQEFYPWVMVDARSVLEIRRRHTLIYFPENV